MEARQFTIGDKGKPHLEGRHLSKDLNANSEGDSHENLWGNSIPEKKEMSVQRPQDGGMPDLLGRARQAL